MNGKKVYGVYIGMNHESQNEMEISDSNQCTKWKPKENKMGIDTETNRLPTK